MHQNTRPPIVSIVMPCYNAAPHLSMSIDSIQAQTFNDWELIAVDDGSTDDTRLRLNALTDPRISVHTQRNQGVSAARNAGLKVAQGGYVAFLDADDTWTPDFLAHMVKALAARPDAALAYCGWQNLGVEGGRGAPFVPPEYETPDKATTLFSGCRWPIHAALTRRSALRDAGGFSPALKNAEDFHLWLKIAIPAPIVRVPHVLAFYHFHSQSQASSNNARSAFHHWLAQLDYLKLNPGLKSALGRKLIRDLTAGELLKRGYVSYWRRDLDAARQIFRQVMRLGYGTPRDWKYMLPALLPISLHRRLIRLLQGDAASSTEN